MNIAEQTPKLLDIDRIRADFPILNQHVHNKPLVYLDNAATTQKPLTVIETLDRYYREDNANIHRGLHTLSERSTENYEAARESVRRYINARDKREIIFVRGTTEAINLVANSFVRPGLQAGDEILISALEHHSNIVPWQMLCEQTGATLKVIPINDDGEIMLDDFYQLIGPKTKILAVNHVSNALGTINPIKKLIACAKTAGVPVLLDGAQAVAHIPVDLQELDCDFYAFSGHKLFGPTGIGVLFGRAELLEAMPPWQGGGDMIKEVTFDQTVYNDIPYKFEAGTPHIAGPIGLAAAINYVSDIGLDVIYDYEHQLLDYATRQITQLDGVRLIGTAKDKTSVLSFVLDGIHAHDLGMLLDHEGVAIRAGHHCAMPVMQHFGVNATARVSIAFYNTRAEIDHFISALNKAQEIFA